MKNIKSFVFPLIAACVLAFILDYGGLFRYKINFETSSSDIDPETGEKTTILKARHWYHFSIVRSEFYFGLNDRGIDSIKAFEISQGEKIKKHLNQ